jgi:hypothetical protein
VPGAEPLGECAKAQANVDHDAGDSFFSFGSCRASATTFTGLFTP